MTSEWLVIVIFDSIYDDDQGYLCFMKRQDGQEEDDIAGVGVTRAFSVGGRTSTSGAVALSRTLVSSWWAYFHHVGGHIIFLSLMDVSSFWWA